MSRIEALHQILSGLNLIDEYLAAPLTPTSIHHIKKIYDQIAPQTVRTCLGTQQNRRKARVAACSSS